MTDTSKRWRYLDPPERDGDQPVVVEMSENEIVKVFFSYWSDQMRRVGKRHMITRQHCIDDWVVVNWAEPIK